MLGAGVCAGWLAPSAAAVAPPSQKVGVGAFQSCSITGGRIFCWGDNSNGELGNNSTTSSAVPVPVDTSGVLAGKTMTNVSAGNFFTCALDAAGKAYCWGQGGSGRLGDGSGAQSQVPVPVSTSGVLAGTTLTHIAASTTGAFACAVATDGRAYCWGDNSDGQLGNNSGTASMVPVAVSTSGVLAGKTLVSISVGRSFGCALDAAGNAYCWGSNSNGQLGDNSTTASRVPVAVTMAGPLATRTLAVIAAGGSSACAVDNTAAASCWGSGGVGQLGTGTFDDEHVPTLVDALGVLAGKTMTAITVGDQHSCALDSAGKAYCWGANFNGQLGDNSNDQELSPVAVYTGGALAGVTLTEISAGVAATCARDASGAVYCWGNNSSGQLGNGSSGNTSPVPVPVNSVAPGPPVDVAALARDRSAVISWRRPAFIGKGTLTGYTATAQPGGEACSTTGVLTCVITGLTNNTTYTVTVVTHTTVADSEPSSPVAVTPRAPGVLAITVAAAATLPSVAPGGSSSGHLGTVTVSDREGGTRAEWTATVTTSPFSTGQGVAEETIGRNDISYWSGPATDTSGPGTFTPGQPTAADAVTLDVTRTAFSHTGGRGTNSASWNPTVVVAVPGSAVAGTYTATITHSVS